MVLMVIESVAVVVVLEVRVIVLPARSALRNRRDSDLPWRRSPWAYAACLQCLEFGKVARNVELEDEHEEVCQPVVSPGD